MFDLDFQIAALIKRYGHSEVLASAKRQATKTGRPALDASELIEIAEQDAERFAANEPLAAAKTTARQWSQESMSTAEREAKITRLAKKLSPSRSYRRRAMLATFIERNWTTSGEPQIERVFKAIEALPGAKHLTQRRRDAVREARVLLNRPENEYLLTRLATGSKLQRAAAHLVRALRWGDETE